MTPLEMSAITQETTSANLSDSGRPISDGAGRFGLSRKERITNAREFEYAYKNGAIKKTGCLIIRTLANNLGYSRLGIAVSKKLFPSSVVRNRIKRMIREAFRLNKHQLPKGLDLIIGIRSNGPKSFTLPTIQAGLADAFTVHS